MLFDLKSGKRRRAVQIVFGFLAFMFFISFVGFGIGSDVSGGLFDALGIGGGSSSTQSTSAAYEQQIDEAEKTLDAHPKDTQALTDLARYRFLSGQDQLELDASTGVATLTDDARNEWNLALDAWEKLLRSDPQKVDAQVGSQMVCAYVPPLPQCGIQASAEGLDLTGAARTQRFIAAQDKSAGAYFQLSQFLYFDGDFKGGDAAADQALAATEPGQRAQLGKDLDKLSEQAHKFVSQQKKATQAGGEDPSLQDPFGGLGTGAGGALGGTGAPTP